VLYRVLVITTAIGRRIPLRVGQAFGRALGSLAWHLVRRERCKALANIAVAFPEWSDAARRDTIRAMFRHLGMSVFEIAWLWNMDAERFARHMTIEGAEAVRARIALGRPIVIFTAHCGNWEWLALAIARHLTPLTALQRERDDPEMNRYISEFRRRGGITTIDRGSAASARTMISAIRKGSALGFLIDQNIRAESVRVPFFGRPAATPVGPARLAIRVEADAVPSFIERTPDGRHLVRFLAPIPCRRDDDPIELTARITRAIEDQIRRAPTQWVWMHDRWRERPQWDVTPPETPDS
jgi:Kdo2-lipid IVA lauroyltransferase/acyltransferase